MVVLSVPTLPRLGQHPWPCIRPSGAQSWGPGPLPSGCGGLVPSNGAKPFRPTKALEPAPRMTAPRPHGDAVPALCLLCLKMLTVKKEEQN
ncbi:hypothetical protein CB1_000331040 [Camelus ferus]|nr:hypothetical protein CB1_000331040 [Camelus ferus]